MPKTVPNGQIKAVFVVIVNDDGKVLVIRRSPDEETRPGEWECPGGKVNPGESPKQTAHRETKEEVGLEILVGNQARLSRPEDGDGYTLMVRARPLTHQPKLDQGHDKYGWADEAQITKLKPTHPGWAENVRHLMKFNQKRAARIAAVNRQRVAERQKAEEIAKDVQAIFTSLETPSWQSVWNIGNLKAPDWDAYAAQKESTEEKPVTEVPGTFDEATAHEYSKGKKDSPTNLYNTVRDVLEQDDLLDYANITDEGDKVELDSEDSDAVGKIVNSLRRAGIRRIRLAGLRTLVIGPYRRSNRDQGDIYRSYYNRPRRAAPAPATNTNPANNAPPVPKATNPPPPSQNQPGRPPTTQVPVQRTPIEQPASQLQENLGPGVQVQTHPNDPNQLLVETTQPAQTVPQIQQAIQQNRLPLAIAGKARRAKQSLVERYHRQPWFVGAAVSFKGGRPKIAFCVKKARSGRTACGCDLPRQELGIPIHVIQVEHIPGPGGLDGTGLSGNVEAVSDALQNLFRKFVDKGKHDHVEFDPPGPIANRRAIVETPLKKDQKKNKRRTQEPGAVDPDLLHEEIMQELGYTYDPGGQPVARRRRRIASPKIRPGKV
jgi:8-oxo-dGTP pyrophosphatase MutT (NUDIX family)